MHSKPSIVMTFYNSDPFTNPLLYTKHLIDKQFTTSLSQIFNNQNFIYKQFNNLDKTTMLKVLQYSKCIGHDHPHQYIHSNQPYASSRPSNSFDQTSKTTPSLPHKTLEPHAKIFIFVGAIIKEHNRKTRPSPPRTPDNSPYLILSDGTLIPINSEIIGAISSPCPFIGLNKPSPHQPLIFIFLSTRANPKIQILPPPHNTRSLEIWSIFNKSVDYTYGYSSVQALHHIHSMDFTLPIPTFYSKIEEKYPQTTGISFFKNGTFTNNSLIHKQPDQPNLKPCCSRCFPSWA